MAAGRRRHAQRSLRRRDAPARRHAWSRRCSSARRLRRLRRQPRASRRHRRHEPRARCRWRPRSTRKACACRRCGWCAAARSTATSSTSSSPTRASPTSAAATCSRSLRRCASATPRFAELVERDGQRRHRTRAMTALQDYSERLHARRAAPRCRAGVYRADDVLDDDGLGAERHSDRGGDAPRRRPRRGRLRRHARRRCAAASTPTSPSPWRPCTTCSARWPRRRFRPTPASCGRSPCARRRAQCRQRRVSRGGRGRQRRDLAAHRRRAPARRWRRALPERIPAASCGSMNNLAFGGSVPPVAGRRRAGDAVLVLRDHRRRRRRRAGARRLRRRCTPT